MEINISKAADLQNLLKKAISATEKKSALPILSNFLLEAKDDRLIVRGTDLEVYAFGSLPAKVEKEGTACINAKKLTDISKHLPGSEVYIKLEDNTLKIKSGKTRYKLPISPAEEFPAFPDFPEENMIVISGLKLQTGIQKTIYATSKEETRFALQGVLFKSTDKGIDLVATDGHRLALYTINTDSKGDINVIVPQKALMSLKRLILGLEDIEVGFSGDFIFFRSPEWGLVSRLIEGAFPDYTKVIPQDFAYEIKVNKKEFLDAVKRVSAVIEGEPKPVKLLPVVEDKILRLSDKDNMAEDEIPMVVEKEGEVFPVSFNARYLIEAVEAIHTDFVKIKLTSPNSQSAFEPVQNADEGGSYIAIIMPMEI